MTVVFQYNQEQAVTSGEGGYISQSGAYTGRITYAKWAKTQNGAKGLELSIETDEGLKANYITIFHTKIDGSPNQYGQAHINAIMGILGLQNLTAVQRGNDYICQELKEKQIGLVLQKVLRTKQDGSDTYKFEIIVPFHPQTRQTLKEKVEQESAERVGKILTTLSDKDERETKQQAYGQTPPPPQRQTPQQAAPVDDIDDDIPF
ncbi:hypothetical protein BWD09_07175 [Neisseria dentiae]|uniref:DUF669 domain-containing protein n=1 Tax=Neisseria dentiae TaxID=194197 RepID=A0A1X3D9P8_9NEIS|nr:hypothetical protein [Neisseria dentiae]OSI16536.1 hypothetical protein BWD09_07175 [Neisseria dentiae]QMT44260.1 DUF669 domain-containing protein [Neisseria dentiae]STZ49895.1 Uncharacterised protein [Neisseria dentiae]STZ49939.1 Uncharacterised protein [Neisseria dentiae]